MCLFLYRFPCVCVVCRESEITSDIVGEFNLCER